MTDSRSSAPPWRVVKALFEAVVELPAGGREAWIAAADADDPTRAELRSLLAHHEQDTGQGGFMDAPAARQVLGPPGGAAAGEGQSFGAWQIVRPVGTGGMGDVFEARRADGQFEGRAAIKRLKRGMDSAAVLQRFAQERQALARLNHPHIAQLFDAGLSDDGLPYFVMEFVDGRPIDEAARALPIDRRLALFLQLTDAVAHAHRNLLVHRDLKPGNVLVTPQLQVKLLDFGIAKALDPSDDVSSDTTIGTQRPFTPNYASPEQVRGEPVTTATDIYSLGVLLHQLLTGLRPTGRNATTPAEAARSVLEETPTRPSSLRPDLVNDPQWMATRRRLKGDLDNILLKALEKRVERRYASVDDLAQDVRHCLAGYPVSARAPTAGYVAAKFIGRHKVSVAAAAVALVAVLGGVAATAWQAHEARLARDEARRQLGEIKRITTDLVFRFGDTVTFLPGGAKTQEALLKQTLRSLEPALQAEPNDPELMALIASVLGRLAELQGNTTMAAPERAGEAEATVARAVALSEAAWPAKHGDWRFANWYARTLIVKAQLLRGQGRLAEAAATLKTMTMRSAEALATKPGDEGEAYLLAGAANAQIMKAQLFHHQRLPSLNQPDSALKEYAVAEQGLRQLLARKALLDALDRDAVEGDVRTEVYLTHQLATVLGGRALIYQKLEDLPAMRREAEAAVAMHQSNVAREPKNLVWRNGLMTESNTLAVALIRLGEVEPALVAATLGWNAAESLARDGGPNNQWLNSKPMLAAQYGRALAGVGRLADALPVYDLGISMWSARLQAGPNADAARRLAWFQMHRALAMPAHAQRAAAIHLLRTANAALRGLTVDPVVGREAQLALAEGLAAQARWQPRDAAALRAEARVSLQSAAAAGAIGVDRQRLLDTLR